MSTQKGCKFCTRYGLPLLPVRPAVVARDDVLPLLPGSVAVPAVAKGETAWTGRLLREGYLYIWSESGNRWINYFVNINHDQKFFCFLNFHWQPVDSESS